MNLKLIIALCLLPLATQAQFVYLETDFDALPHKSAGGYSTLTNGGITFSTPVFAGGKSLFTIQFDDTNDLSTLVQEGYFTPPNYLTFNGYTPDGYSFGAIHQFSISFNGVGSSASLTLLGSSLGGFGVGNTISLEAFMGSSLVDSANFTVPNGTLFGDTLSISGVPFTSLELISHDSSGLADTFLGIDQVEISATLPEPSTWSMLLLGTLALFLVPKLYLERNCLGGSAATVRHSQEFGRKISFPAATAAPPRETLRLLFAPLAPSRETSPS